MSLKTKYNLRRKITRMSWNKYNILILKRSYRIFKRYQYKKKKTGVGRGYYVKYFAKCLLKKYYGDIKEKSLRKILKKSEIKNYYHNKNKIFNFFILLESRLDVILFRMNFASSIYASRQLITHGHVMVNDKIIRGSNYYLKKYDIIKIKYNSIDFVKSILKLDKKNIKFKLIKKYKYFTLSKNIIVNYRILTGIYLNEIKLKEIRYPFNFNKVDFIRYFL